MGRTSTVLGIAALALAAMLVMTLGDADKALAGRSTCPAGTQKFVRVCIDKEPRPEANFDDASKDCADERRRLPTGAELEAFRQQPGIVLGEIPGIFEWTGNIFDEDQTLAITDPGAYANQAQSATEPYRCVK